MLQKKLLGTFAIYGLGGAGISAVYCVIKVAEREKHK
jgi:hypothetical protein